MLEIILKFNEVVATNEYLVKQTCPSSDLEWGPWQNNGRLTWPAPIQSPCSAVPQFYTCPWHHECSVPLALSELSAPGTFNVQCPWHFHNVHCAVVFSSLSGFWYHLSLYAASPSQDGIGTSLSSVGFLSFSTLPLGMEWIVVQQVTVPPKGNWAESSSTGCYSSNGVCNGVVHCLMLASL